MDVLGITGDRGSLHDSSVVWVRDGRIQLAVSEERLTRVKHDGRFPANSLRYVLNESGLRPDDFAAVGVAWKPYNAFSGFFARSLWDVPGTVGAALLCSPRRTLRYAYRNLFKRKFVSGASGLAQFGFPADRIEFMSHHLAHAASAYRTSGFERALSINLDCFGPDAERNLWSGAAFRCGPEGIELLEYVPPYASLGLFYSAVSVALGFRFGDGEGKTMGLAAYGDPQRAYDALRVVAPRFTKDGWRGHRSWANFRLIDDAQLMLATPWGRYLHRSIEQTSREDIAAAAQRILEEELHAYVTHLLARSKLRNIVLAGGIFQNVTFNRKLTERSDVQQVFVHPFASDGGTAAGAALESYARHSKTPANAALITAALGPSFSAEQIEAALRAHDERIAWSRPQDLARETARLIAAGNIVGWFQGAEEWGPRALGQRSVLGDPRTDETKKRLNQKLKSRDWFMPFAPSILEEYGSDYLDNYFYSPFMTFTFRIREDKKAVIPAGCHHDGTARPNIVRGSVQPEYHRLIEAFRQETGIPVVLNTSFNRHGLPLVHRPEHAIQHLLWGCVDALAIGPFLVKRTAEIEAVDAFTREAHRAAYVGEDAYGAAGFET